MGSPRAETEGEKKDENDFDAKQRTETTWMTMVRTQRDRQAGEKKHVNHQHGQEEINVNHP